MEETEQVLLSLFLTNYADTVQILLEASCVVGPLLSFQLLQRAGEELGYLLQVLGLGLLPAEQYAALAERGWQLQVQLQEQLLWMSQRPD